MARRTRLSLETLESRQLMAFDAFLHLDGIPGESKVVAPEVGDPFTPVGDIKSAEGEDEVLIGLLVPAVQKVREAAARMNEEPNLPISNDQEENGILIGLLLPAVQKVREAAAVDQPLEDLTGEEPTDGDVIPTDQLSLNFAKIQREPIVDLDLDLDFVDQDAEVYLRYKLTDCIISS